MVKVCPAIVRMAKSIPFEAAMNEIETLHIDTRYSSYRRRNPRVEKYLLGMIAQQGVLDPVYGVYRPDEPRPFLLLDGFKRYRCAVKLNIPVLPSLSFGEDEVSALLIFLRHGNRVSLTVLEEALLIDGLRKKHGLSTGEIGRRLCRSPSWVSVRQGLIEDMSPRVRAAIMEGRFPARAYLYSVRPFTRVKGVSGNQVEQFVQATAGKGLTTRELHILARPFFTGDDEITSQIINGDVRWTLQTLKADTPLTPSPRRREGWSLADNLWHCYGCMNRLNGLIGKDMESDIVHITALIKALRSLSRRCTEFTNRLGALYDRCRKTECGADVAPAGNTEETNCSTSET